MQLIRPITEIRTATPRARIVYVDLEGSEFPFLAGQAISVGEHGQELRKPYSIASSPEDVAQEGRLELLVGVDAAGEAGPHLPLQIGTRLDIEGPAGGFTFPIEPDAPRFLFIGGGTGISPLRSMLRHSMYVPHDSLGLMYSARLPEEFAYDDEFRAMSEAGLIELRMTVTRDVEAGQWTGTRGRISRSDLEPLVHDGRTLCFVCGPPTLVDEMPKLLEKLGVPRTCVKTEEWG